MEQRFPGALDGQRLNKVQRAAVVDAMCIAAWSRLQARSLTLNPRQTKSRFRRTTNKQTQPY
ncbi:MAG: hypothetical protein RL514_4840 [Verrucomicrobiota bacterium]